MAQAFVWVKPPGDLARAVDQYGAKLLVAVRAIADFIAQKMQDDARRGAPWTDRTGNARSGLFAVADKAAHDMVTIYLSHGHTVWYGQFLELAHGARYAIIMPTIQRNLPVLERMLKQLLG
jgi:hypothetical protein